MNKEEKINIIIETTGFKNTYINHFVNFINVLTNADYFGIKINGDNIIIDEININYLYQIVQALLFKEDKYLKFDAIKSIKVKAL